MAARFLDASYTVYGEERSKEHAQALVNRGLHWRNTPREIAETVDVIFTYLPDDAALELVASSPDGIPTGITAGTIWVDMSTVSPHASREVAERVRARNAMMLDAPVSGSVPHMLAFSEGLLLAERAGIDRSLARDVMTQSPIGSPMLKARADLVFDRPEEAWFDVNFMHKDIALALEAASELGVAAPSATAADGVLKVAQDLDYGERDIAALFEVLGQLSDDRARSPA